MNDPSRIPSSLLIVGIVLLVFAAAVGVAKWSGKFDDSIIKPAVAPWCYVSPNAHSYPSERQVFEFDGRPFYCDVSYDDDKIFCRSMDVATGCDELARVQLERRAKRELERKQIEAMQGKNAKP